jgi:hypothetical protein
MDRREVERHTQWQEDNKIFNRKLLNQTKQMELFPEQ